MKQVVVWVSSAVIAIIWGFAGLVTISFWSLSPLDSLLSQPLTLSPTGETVVSQMSSPPMGVAVGLAAFGTVVSLVLAAGIFRLLGRRVGPWLFAVAAGPVGAFVIYVSVSVIGLQFDPPGSHVGDVLGMQPTTLVGIALILLVPCLVTTASAVLLGLRQPALPA